jgi:organic hydroperoxide reductase OsmC/OhrA
LASVGRRLNLDWQNLKVRVTGKFAAEGSVLRGDRSVKADSYAVEVSLDSGESPERLQQALREAEVSCFTIAALRNPVPVELTTTVNGELLPPK